MPSKDTPPKEVATPKKMNKTKKYRIWAVVATAVAVAFLIGAVILIIALVATNNARQKCEQTKATVKTVTTDVAALNGSKLITKSDLYGGEIPDHYLGNKDSRVVVVEYEDFACSHCQALSQSAEQIHADYQDRVLFIHRGFNLGFPNSLRTMQAAEAAYKVGGEQAYWAMAKLLYQDTKWVGSNVPNDSKDILNGYAKEIGLDTGEFEKATTDPTVTAKISRDKSLGLKADVRGTPTWIINGEQVTAIDKDIRAALDAALQ